MADNPKVLSKTLPIQMTVHAIPKKGNQSCILGHQNNTFEHSYKFN